MEQFAKNAERPREFAPPRLRPAEKPTLVARLLQVLTLFAVDPLTAPRTFLNRRT
jgi:hypothetical protein